MKEMNSLTHSCMHSFASFAIFAFSGKAIFMMRATGAKLRMLASDAALLAPGLAVDCGADGEGCGESRDMTGWLQDSSRLTGTQGRGRALDRNSRSDSDSKRDSTRWRLRRGRKCYGGCGQPATLNDGLVRRAIGGQIMRGERTEGKIETYHLLLEAIGPVP